MPPKKTYMVKECELYESDFDVCGEIKARRVMEMMQDVATAHADELGFGWDVLNSNGVFWVLSKVKIVFNKPVTRVTRKFKLYTWPQAPERFFVERRFEATDENDVKLFSCSTLWLMVERDTRKIARASTVSKLYNADFDDSPCDADTSFERVRRGDGFSLAYERKILRSDLDINRHVNNTNYVTYAIDAVNEGSFSQIEIAYHKELMLNDTIAVYVLFREDCALISGEREGETCFTAKLTFA